MRINDEIIDKLKVVARKSDVRSQHAAAIVDRKTGKIITVANNYHFHKPPSTKWCSDGKYTMHAEEAVFNKFKRNYHHLLREKNRYNLIVVRAHRHEDGCLHSKPCHKCTQMLNKLIKKKIIYRVYYSMITCQNDHKP